MRHVLTKTGLVGMFVVLVFSASMVNAQMVHVYEWIEVNASADEIWEKAGGFCDIQLFAPAEWDMKCTLTGDGGIGSIRHFKAGDDYADETMVDQGKGSLSYLYTRHSTQDGFWSLLPVARYRATFRVFPAPAPGKAIADWVASFDGSAYADNGVKMEQTLHDVLKQLLEGLKKLVE